MPTAAPGTRSRNRRSETMTEPRESDDVYGDTPEEEREIIRGEQGTSGDEHDDSDPQQGR
ncbi:predicted protein [Streptomyces sp. AA4]|nr:predicted protein [Streptomyces sp. AA4]